MRSAIRSMILAAAGVSSVVGQRVYPRRVPQGETYPAISYDLQIEPGVNHGGREKLDRISVGIDCHAREAPGKPASTAAAALADVVAEAMSGARATHSGWTLSFGTASVFDDGLDEETGIYSVAVELSGWARRP